MNDFGSKIYAAAQKAVKEVYDLDVTEGQLVVETPQDTRLGDYSTSIAMKLSRTLRRNPMEIAEPLAARLSELLPECESVTVARPGFINFKLKQSALAAVINRLRQERVRQGQAPAARMGLRQPDRRSALRPCAQRRLGRLHRPHDGGQRLGRSA